MIDTLNQRIHYSYPNLPIDRVEGFTLAELEDCLYDNFTWDDWRDAIKELPNPTSEYVDELFNNYDAK